MSLNIHKVKLPDGSKLDLRNVRFIGGVNPAGNYSVILDNGTTHTINIEQLCKAQFSIMCKEARGHQLQI